MCIRDRFDSSINLLILCNCLTDRQSPVHYFADIATIDGQKTLIEILAGNSASPAGVHCDHNWSVYVEYT